MTPINNNQMSEQELPKNKWIRIYNEGNQLKWEVLEESQGLVEILNKHKVTHFISMETGENIPNDDLIGELSTLISRERAEAVKQFRKELVKLYPAFPNEQTLANIEFWKTLMDKAEEYLSNERGK